MKTRFRALPRLAGRGAGAVALLLLGACSVFEPNPSLNATGPVQPKDHVRDPIQSIAYRHFEAAFKLADQDEFEIKSGKAKAGKASQCPSPFYQPKAGKDGVETLEATDCYSPLHYQTYTKDDKDELERAARQTETLKEAADKTVTKAESALAAAQKKKAAGGPAEELAAAATALADAIARQKTATDADDRAKLRKSLVEPGDRKPGGSYQSIHARAMADAGIALADENCATFFALKSNVKTNASLLNTVVSKLGSVVGGAVGASGGGAAVPTAFSLANPFFSASNDILNQEFLFGASSIDSVYRFVSIKSANHKVAALPEPDNSDWTFQRAADAIRAHQALCRSEYILTLLKDNAAKVEVKDTGSNPSSNTARPSQGVSAPTADPPK